MPIINKTSIISKIIYTEIIKLIIIWAWIITISTINPNMNNFVNQNIIFFWFKCSCSFGSHMLDYYNLLEELKISNFNTSSWVDFSRMFEGCAGLKSID